MVMSRHQDAGHNYYVLKANNFLKRCKIRVFGNNSIIKKLRAD